jgi:hypothetical protein
MTSTTNTQDVPVIVKAMVRDALRRELTPFATPARLDDALCALALSPAYAVRARAEVVISELPEKDREPFRRAVRSLIGIEV